jgi:hypothetical protein
MVVPEFSAAKQTYEALFSDLFFELSTTQPIEITLNGTYPNARKVRISFQPLNERPLLPHGELKGDVITDKIFTLSTAGAGNDQSVQQVNLMGSITTNGSHKEANIGFFSSTGIGNAQALAQMLSSIRIINQSENIEATMRKLYPQISNLSPELTGGIAEIYCKVVGLQKKVPLTLVSTGINRVLAMLLFIATHQDGVVLIDEIENGVYFKTLPKLLAAIIDLCKELNVQLFASTHSKEFLENLTPLIENHENDFRLIRTEANDGDHTARIFQGKDFESALITGVDPR